MNKKFGMRLMSNLRMFLRNFALDIISFNAKPAAGIHILNGHTICRSGNPSEDIFRAQLKKLNRVSTFIKVEDAVELICKREKTNDTLIAFTFDDGFDECSTIIAPTLEEFNTNGLFFINPNFVEGDKEYINNFTNNIVMTPGKNPMRWDDILKIQKTGHIIGAHTMDHYMINSNDISELESQIGNCKGIIESKLGVPCEYFAFPYGKLEHANQASIDIATKYYKYVFSQSDYKNYFSYDGRVINRRHFEPFWPVRHVKYFISHQKKY